MRNDFSWNVHRCNGPNWTVTLTVSRPRSRPLCTEAMIPSRQSHDDVGLPDRAKDCDQCFNNWIDSALKKLRYSGDRLFAPAARPLFKVIGLFQDPKKLRQFVTWFTIYSYRVAKFG